MDLHRTPLSGAGPGLGYREGGGVGIGCKAHLPRRDGKNKDLDPESDIGLQGGRVGEVLIQIQKATCSSAWWGYIGL